jgi:recombination protein RecA
MFGNPETTTGGKALKFYASVRIDIRYITSIKVGGEIIGTRTKIRVVKNKVSPPFRQVEVDIMYNEGISRYGDLLDLAVEMDLITKRGSYYYYGEDNLAQGRQNAKDYLSDHLDFADHLEDIIRHELLGEGEPPEMVEDFDEEDQEFEEENLPEE